MPSRDKKNDKPFKIPKQREETTAVCLKELNLDTELLTQYKNAKDLLHEAMDDEEIPLNQKGSDYQFHYQHYQADSGTARGFAQCREHENT